MDHSQLVTGDRDPTPKKSTTIRLFDEMLGLIESGKWAIGEPIPSERTLMEKFGVSRIALRESLSMLRALGVLDISHGRKTTVRRMNSELLGRLFPLMLSLEGEQTLEHIFQLRIGIESESAYLAALNRSEDDLKQLREIGSRFASYEYDTTDSIQADHEFHALIAKMTGNPLFVFLLNSLGGFVRFAQRESGKMSPYQRARAVAAHQSILLAIADGNAKQARTSMISHLQDAKSTASQEAASSEPI